MPTRPVDSHVRFAAYLHIAAGALGALLMVVLMIMVAVFASSMGMDSATYATVTGIGLLLLGLGLALFAGEIVGAVLALRGSEAGRITLFVYSGLSLVNFPLGTALGGYTLWALLRTPPASGPASAFASPSASASTSAPMSASAATSKSESVAVSAPASGPKVAEAVIVRDPSSPA